MATAGNDRPFFIRQVKTQGPNSFAEFESVYRNDQYAELNSHPNR